MPKKILKNQSNLFTTAHGVLIDIRGLGVLLIGESGVGKSENALDLITRGSRLISDDVVEIRKSDSGRLIGTSPDKIEHLMEIRGLGIINIKDLFGTDHILDKKQIDMVIELTRWDSDTEYDRLGTQEKSYNLMGVDLPYLLIPVRPGRNTTTILEVAALNQLLKSSDAKSKERILDQLENVKTTTGIK